MSKKIIITSQLLIFMFINTFSQSDTTVCIDFNPDLNQKFRKNIISLNLLVGSISGYQSEIGYERIIKENKTITASFGGYFYNNYFYLYKSFHCNLAYRLYFSNRKYAKTKINNNKYYIRKQKQTMSAPKGLYIGTMTYFNFKKENLYQKRIDTGLGVDLGYQFLFFNRIALNTTLQLPLTFDGYFYYQNNSLGQKEWSVFYSIRPKIFINLKFGVAF